MRMVNSFRFGLRAKMTMLDRGVLEAPVGNVTMTANSAYYGTVQPYKHGDAWGYGFISYLAPNINAHIKLQLESVKTYNADELTVKLVSEDLANAPMGALLSRYGKLEYALASATAGTKTVSVRPVTVGAKQVRFSFLLKEVGTMAMSVDAGSIAITDASGAAVAASALEANTWYTAVIANNGGTVGNTTLTVGSGAVSMLIKDMAAYTTTDAPVKGETGIFRGLDADEMLLAGYLAPREGYLIGNTPKPSMVRDDIYAALAAAGINYLADNQVTYSGADVESAREMLRLAAKYGINQWMRANDVFVVGDVLSTETKTATHDWASREYTHYNYWNVDAGYEKVKEKLAEMYQFESFGGLYLRDEPRSDLFTLIGTGLTYMRNYVSELQAAGDTDAVLNGFVNLLPGVGNSAWTNDSEDIGGWQGYINAFINRTGANYVMFDMYPLEGEEGQAESSFFDYLGQMGYTAGQAGLPWMGAVQVGGGKPSYDEGKRVATEGDTHWDVNTMLAFGAKGLIYYMTVSPPYFTSSVDDTTKDNHSLINVYGETTVYHDYPVCQVDSDNG